MNEEPILTEKPTQESQEKKNKREFRQGFWTSFLVNGFITVIFLCMLIFYAMEGLQSQFQWVWGAIWLLVNFLLLIYLYWKNQKAFQGMVAGVALGFLIAVIAGVFLGAICFNM